MPNMWKCPLLSLSLSCYHPCWDGSRGGSISPEGGMQGAQPFALDNIVTDSVLCVQQSSKIPHCTRAIELPEKQSTDILLRYRKRSHSLCCISSNLNSNPDFLLIVFIKYQHHPSNPEENANVAKLRKKLSFPAENKIKCKQEV